MQLRVWSAGVIFIGSYLPLSLILLAQDFQFSYLKNSICFKFWTDRSRCVLPFAFPEISISIFLICLSCFLVTLIVLSVVKTNKSIRINSVKYVPSELMNYTLPYVVSFMGVGYHDQGKFLGIIIFLVWIFWITFKSGQIILNPILVVFGWRLNEIGYSFSGDAREHNTIALVKGDLVPGSVVKFNSVQDVMIIRAQDE